MIREKNKLLEVKDYILLGLLVLIYSIIALYNLGSLKAPQTYWKPSSEGESFYVDFGETKSIERIYHFSGIGEGKYQIAFSNDAETWEDAGTIEQPGIYIWRYLNVDFNARFVKVTVQTPNAIFNELGFFEKNNETPIKIKKVVFTENSEVDGGTPNNLFDEQDTIAYIPSYLNGMYFDEIYHARTAYEHLNKIEPYETTHPPLGKILIALGIYIFGMNPFGWRIIGTVLGILMIPLMYLFGKKLFKKTEYAFITAFLMTFDFMHFTQTRIATIDVYAVFFIIIMYYFMYEYYMVNYYENKLLKILLPLALSGVFFGFGAASKWTCIYAGAGLAVIFFTSFFKHFSEYNNAKKILNNRKLKRGRPDIDKLKNIVYIFPRYSKIIISWCIVFFVLIPMLIYFLSYIPFMMVPGPGHGPINVITYQGHMYRYHKNLDASHSFSSKPLEWPLLKKPIWYYTGKEFLPSGKASSIVAMGNPAIWWLSIPAVLIALIISIQRKDKKIYPVLVGFAAQYLPWILVPRLVFIYHFFTSIPFVIFCIVYVLKYYMEKCTHYRYYIYGYLTVVLSLFIMFYPVLSGAVVNQTYIDKYLKWFSGWHF